VTLHGLQEKKHTAVRSSREVITAQDGQPVWASLVRDGTPIGRGAGSSLLVNLVDEITLESPRAIRALAQRSNRGGYGGVTGQPGCMTTGAEAVTAR
jgi:hypothetical protein